MEGGRNMPYIYKPVIIIDGDTQNLYYQNIIEETLEKLLLDNDNVQFLGVTINELNTHNCGKCHSCGIWVSDHEQPKCIEELSDGIFFDEKWWCDLCLPNNHPRKFI